ncbi:ATP-binding protein [Catenulispora yoronensis]
MPADIELSGYRIVQEALTNVVRHSGARECRVTVDYREEELAIEIIDAGRGQNGQGGQGGQSGQGCVAGLDREREPERGAGPHGGYGKYGGYGIPGMRERVSLLHGDFTAGPRPDGGFRVAARLPVPAGAHR